MNLQAAIEQYLLTCRVNNISEKTIQGYQYHLGRFANVIGNPPVNELSANQIRAFVAEEMGRKNEHTGKELSSFTLNKAYGVVRAFCNWMVNEGLIQSSPTERTRAPRVDNDLPEALTSEEIIRIFNYLETRCTFRDKVIFEFFLDTGCRVNEVANLTVDDIHITEGWAKVFGKGRREAIVPLGATLCKDLEQYITRFRRAPEDENGLFVSNVAPYHRLTRDGIITMVKRVHKACNINGKYGPHKLRHTMATQFIINGGDVSVLRRILRHSNIVVTQRYINLVQNDVQAAHREFSPLDRLKR